MYDPRGSVWRKWDLHLHSPYTRLNNNYDEIDISEYADSITDAALKAVGITNYFLFNGDELEKLNEKLKDTLLIPNVEFRINGKNKEGDYINIHVLFNPSIGIDKIKDVLNRVKLNNIPEDNVFINENSLSKYPTDSITVSFDDLLEKLYEHLNHIDDFLIASCASGYGNFRPDNSPRFKNLAKKIDKASDVIFGNENDRDFFLNEGEQGEKRLQGGFPKKPVLLCSDSHSNDEIGNKYTWIKADPTFEGLKQVVFEPKYRVKIVKKKPNEPLIKIDKVVLELPNDSKLDKQDFCLQGKYEIQFSPFFTCFIGGRGTGKSSILNLIDHYISDERNKFFEKHELTGGNGDKLDIEKIVRIEGKSTKGDLEFLSQNEIEEFATDQLRFTKAIYRRLLKLDAKDEIGEAVEQVNREIRIIDENIERYKNLKTHQSQIKSYRRDIEKNENILDSLKDEDYQRNSRELSNKTKRLKRIKDSKDTLENILDLIRQTVEKIPENLDTDIVYERELISISTELTSILDGYNFAELSEESSEEVTELEKEIEDISGKIKEYLEEKGLSEENLKEASTAKTSLDSLLDTVNEREDEVNKIEKELSEYQVDYAAKEKFEQIINEHLESINRKFESLNIHDQEVKQISLDYEFHSNLVKEELAKKVQSWIGTSDIDTFSALRIDHLKSKLFLIEPMDIDEQKTVLEKFELDDSLISNDLYKHFSDEYNFQIYKLMIKREFYDVTKYMKINVYYDERPIRSTSFGQRCTAAIIVLLSLGNSPIIIDEPEAHLDSALIAENLVELIKSTKSQRQIIFATHNANFVVNGDAELIHVLKINEKNLNRMYMTPTTIEDLDNRPELFSLEGGEDAFKQREIKYNF